MRHPPSKASQDGGDYGLGYGAYDVYIAAATMFGALGPPTLYDHPGPAYGSRSFDHRVAAYGSKSFVMKCNPYLTYKKLLMWIEYHFCLTCIEKEDTMDPLKEWAKRYLLAGFHKKQTKMT